MNAKNLPLKFGIIALLIVVCIWALKTNGLRQGIDLKGGHTLIFEVRSNRAEIDRLQEQAQKLRDELAAATEPAAKESLQQSLSRVEGNAAQLRKDASGTTGNLAEDIIKVLKKRIDPQGLSSLEWRPLGNNRIEVRMPAGKAESVEAKGAFSDALDRLSRTNIQRAQVLQLLQTPAADRDAEIKKLAWDEKVAALLRDLIAANEAVLTAEKAGNAEAKDNALLGYGEKMDAVRDSNVNVAELQGILAEYVSAPEAEALRNPGEVKRRMTSFNKRVQEFEVTYASRKDLIDAVAVSYKKWAASRQRLDDPADLRRLIAKAGVLEFRIAPYRPDSAEKFTPVSAADVKQYVDSLKREGPDALRKRNDRFLWFPVQNAREGYGGLITTEYAGKRYILLANEPNLEMLRQAGAGAWSLLKPRAATDSTGQPAVDFEFDEAGAQRMANLTTDNVGRCMAVLLDDEVYSAPVIRSTISDRGQITGRFTQQEVNDLVQTFEAGSLPAKLNPNPISESTFGPAMGETNLTLAVKAGYLSLIAVSGFMLVYYLLTGVIANVALFLHVLLVLGAMSMLNAVFTLPGIAGVILTIGMAVDANVLIYERLREEQEKLQSIRMALKNAYSRAFTVIFDSNVTTLIACLILGWVGTEEVRGFAITLGLGIVFNIFASVTCTRWMFQAMLETGLVKKHFTMLRLIHVPRIDWMAKRYYFWTFSLITFVIAVAAIIWQGKDLLGIEFSAGTEATIEFKDDALLKDPSTGKMVLPGDDKLVRDLFRKEAEAKHYQKLIDQTNVEKIINDKKVDTFLRDHAPAGAEKITRSEWKGTPEFFDLVDANHDGILTREELLKTLPDSSYQVSTTETNVGHIRDVARDAFGNAQRNRTSCAFVVEKGKIDPALKVELAADGKTRLKPEVYRTADRKYHDDLRSHEDGLLLVLRDVKPAITRIDLAQRIRDMRLQPDFAGQMLSQTDVVGLEPAGEDAFSSFAILIMPSDAAVAESPKAWDGFADKELSLVQESLKREESMIATNFEPALAGETSQSAIIAIVLSWLCIIVYLWVRFGSMKWGVAAVVCLVHDVTIIVGLVALSSWIATTAFGHMLAIEPFKIDLAMVAALLTIIGYDVNDTIVVFDRIRENRGKLTNVSSSIINASINQTMSRTILTSLTVIMVCVIMYIWGGPGIHAFNYALIIGVFFGTYSSIAVAAPILMGIRKMVGSRVVHDEGMPTPGSSQR